MKTGILFILLLVISVIGYCQQASVQLKSYPYTFIDQDYLKKSKRQKTAATLLLTSGTVLILTSSYLYIKTELDDYSDINVDENVTTTMAYVGLAAIVSSIPLFIIAGKNKRKAMGIGFDIQPARQIQNTRLVKKPVPSITFKIPLL